MGCSCSEFDPDLGRYCCSVSGDLCMYLVPNAERCAEEFGEGPEAKDDESSDRKMVTAEEFMKQVWDIEGVKVVVNSKDGKDPSENMVFSYDFERLPDDATVDDLKARINSCLNPSVTIEW